MTEAVQVIVPLVTILLTLPPALYRLHWVVFRRFDDAAWASKYGNLLLEHADDQVGGKRHVAMRREVRLEMERSQLAGLVMSRIGLPVLVPYLSTFVAVAFMIAAAVLSQRFIAVGIALSLAVLAAVTSILLTAVYVRNLVLNAHLAGVIRERVVEGDIRLPIDRADLRRNSFDAHDLRQKELWKIAFASMRNDSPSRSAANRLRRQRNF